MYSVVEPLKCPTLILGVVLTLSLATSIFHGQRHNNYGFARFCACSYVSCFFFSCSQLAKCQALYIKPIFTFIHHFFLSLSLSLPVFPQDDDLIGSIPLEPHLQVRLVYDPKAPPVRSNYKQLYQRNFSFIVCVYM